MRKNSAFHRSGGLLASLFFAAAIFGSSPGRAASLIDSWRADSINLNDGDTVGTWTSDSNRTANAAVSVPILKLNATPSGGRVVRFNNTQRLAAGNSPVGGRTAFSIAIVFKPTAAGGNFSGNNWYGKSGIVDAEQGGVTADWGTVFTETGNVGFGIGSTDTSSYSTGPSLVDGAFHVAVFSWGGGVQSIYVDAQAGVSVASPTAARNSAGFSIGGINTDANGTGQRFAGDIAEIRFYDAALSSQEASNVIDELRNTHIVGLLPRIFSFGASTNFIYAGQSATLLWAVSNATSVVIDNGVGPVTSTNSILLSPTNTTTYTLTATNTNGVRTAFVTVTVDPGIPIAFNLATNTAYNVPVAFTLRGFDPQGSNLTYSIVTPPSHGSLSGALPNLTYQPATNFGGFDAFTFKVNDGTFDSAPATVSLNVIPPALPPTGIALSTTNIPSSAGPGAFIAGLQAIDINNLYGDTHTFALAAGGTDNAKFTVTGASLYASPSFIGGPGASFSIRLKTTDSTSFSYTQDVALIVHDVTRSVVINEFHYNPPYNPVRESFIELYNDTDATVDISNWRVRGGVDYFFPANTFIVAHGFVVVADDPATIQSHYGVFAYGPWSGGLNNDGDDITLRDSLNNVVDNVSFSSEFPWPVAANGNGPSAQLVNASLDNDLGGSWRSASPTPGATNSVFSANAAPHIRQVDNSPGAPRSTNQVTITCKVTDPDGVVSVMLAYQVVAPGNYIPATLPLTGAQLNALNSTPMTNALNPVFEASSNWVSVAMHDDGLNGDAVAGDNIFTAVLPQQANRSLVRYRITCTDALGASRRAPFEDDPSLNFAYFVYDGVPNYLGFSSATLQSLPVYSLITRDLDMNQCAAWFAPFNNATDQLPQGIGAARNTGRLYFNWEGAVVYDGKVFDHVHYRLRGANGRYQTGKRSFRIKFNDGALIQPVDNAGKKFPTKWREITTGKGQSNRGGEQFALNEVVSYFLWNKVGTPAPQTFYFHFRVIRGASEAGADQYSGDFWGLNWAQEKYDGRFMDAHNLPKGNLYKLVDNYIDFEDEERYQGTYAPTNGADYFNVQNNLNGNQLISWLNAYANYTNWYRYFTVARAIRHYDTWPSSNKNGAWYFEPNYDASNSFFGRMMQMPYDTTDTWGATWNTGDDLLFNGIFPSAAIGGDAGQHPEMQLDFRNTARELRTLLFQPDQIYQIIDSFAAIAKPVAAADAARWSNAPTPASYLALAIPSSPGVTGGLPAYQQDMKNFMFVGGNNAWWLSDPTYVTTVPAGGWITILDTIITDAAIPNRPTISYVGVPGFPVNGLTFQSSAYSDPQGAGTFAAIQWRVAEVLPTNVVVSNTSQLRLEWDASWVSPEITSFVSSNTFPDFSAQPGLRYRARVRHKDDTGRWSAWSLPVEFMPSPADTTSILKTNLVFNEIMYNPPGDGPTDGDNFEFLELKNIGVFTLNLSSLFFSSGINFTFTNGTSLAPGAVFLLARNPASLATRYPGVVVNGTYTGKLDNDGETIAISHPTAGEIISVTYDDRAPWPVAADGFGYSIVRDTNGNYRASAGLYGTPGVDSPAAGPGGVVVNEFLSNSTLPLKDFIELLNNATTNVDISGWFLTDDPGFPQKFRIPNRPPLLPGELVVFTEDDFNPTPGLGTSFSLSSFGDELYLFSANAGAQLTGYSHGLAFGAAFDGESFGRYVTSAGEEFFPGQITRTPGTANSGPRLGPVVFSEIQYNPEPGGDEFVEIKNLLGTPIPLFDPINPTNTWRVNGVGFNFPTNVTIGSNETLLVTALDPAAFRVKYGVSPAIPIFGPYPGNLQDSGEKLELQQPGVPDTNGLPYITVDEVRYNDHAPWPGAADGNGPSLQRPVAASYGNEPTNWIGALPTPGAPYPGGAPPVITQQPLTHTNVVGDTSTFTVAFTGDPPMNFRWRFNGSPIAGGTNSSLVIPNIQPANAGVYGVTLFNAAGSVRSMDAVQTVPAPVAFTLQPTNQITVEPGTNVTLVSLAVGNGPVRYQWRLEGTNIPGATNASFSFSNASLAFGHGNFSVRVLDDISGNTSSNAFVFVRIRPGITLQPLPQAVVQGNSAMFICVATGAPPITYRWLTNGVGMVTNASGIFIFPNVQLATVTVRAVPQNLAGTVNSSTVSLTMLRDFDGDGIADNWETNYFGFSTNNAADGLLDFDGDGMSNLDEFRAGTNPTNALSVLKLVLTATNANMLEFVAQTNLTYAVLCRTNLTGAPWIGVTNVLPSTAVRTVLVNSVVVPSLPVERYYRVITPFTP